MEVQNGADDEGKQGSEGPAKVATEESVETARPQQEKKGGEEDDEEDEDDDDEDEEDEDDDEGGPVKRQRQERNRFLDIEAEVSEDDEDDEDEEESELVREGFITRDDEHDDDPSANRDDRLHRELDSNLNKTSEEEARRMARELKERYGRADSRQYRAATEEGHVPQRFLLPSVDTAIVWAVGCNRGREKDLVKKLLKRKLTLDRAPGGKKLKILSIFQRDFNVGTIYIEAPKQSVIEKFCNGIPEIYPQRKKLIPVQELPATLKPNKSDDVPLEEGNYVRIKRGVYRGDLAIVDQISENNLEVMLKIVPRLDYGKSDIVDPQTKQRKMKNPTYANRPSRQLFNPTMALKEDQANLYKRDDHHFTYRNEDYIDGFLYKSFRIQYVDTKDAIPEFDDTTWFESKDGKVDLTRISQTVKKHQASKVTFQAGDRVEILSGEQRGSKGFVTKTTTEIATVKLPDLNPLEFPISTLRKIFETGDNVTVVSGNHQGDSGLVVSVRQGQVTFMSTQTRQDVTITANNLSKSIDSTATSSEYALHDIVELSAKKVACIIQATHDFFKVIDDAGKVSTINKWTILSKINPARTRVATVDSKGNEIKIGDMVVEKLGARREGQVLFIHNQQLFAMSKKILENAGVFVVNSSNIEAMASKSNILNTRLDLNKMNPDFVSGMHPPSSTSTAPIAAPARMGREVALGKTVKVRTPGYKGALGIVKDVSGDRATVELHTKNKHITVDKRKLTYTNREGQGGMTYDELVNNRGRVPYSRIGPSYVSAPRGMAAGQALGGAGPQGELPGGMTPDWGAFNGGKTPAVNSHGGAGGGASTWGNSSTWAGQNAGASSTYGGASAWTGQGSGATSTWGVASAWGNKSSYGGASTWASSGEPTGAQSTWGGGNKSSYGGASTWGVGASNKEGGSSTWGGGDNRATKPVGSTHNNNQQQGNSSTWGASSGTSGGNSTWGGH
ncbi:transcription elongation factor SPT5 KNAG_0B03630 [Huiozyma naganishii CBS 8797]|uniref:Transcription elongation factor SPT5 n=1 Tax=Huiozyma naganishii (strain ATCC MYA-139 / BCRC 22969 / CBS 8797 / KCTC 17520 / NBRC 10181 / NCYC 3082 / Yp74L-3) TaxID=1071383 RepID=J7R1W7_HUIN7|nr:hypothetical protein KNAG_0B03630 [Kazachstania naganishii CBS 8797]CCK68805.1 hypothetical protein KNAG_0B03630 [Kazachstania naganishii CBS 8797]